MSSIILFLSASMALIIVPGPDLIYVLTRGISGGRKKGFVSAAGVSTALLVHSVLASLGLAVLLQNSAAAFIFIRMTGGLYLVYLGAKSFKSSTAFSVDGEDCEKNYRICFLQGFLSNMLNPKIILFFLAFLPQFVPKDDQYYSLQLLLRGFLFAFLTLLTFSTLGVCSGTIGRALSRNSGRIRTIHNLSGAVLIVLGGMMLLIHK